MPRGIPVATFAIGKAGAVNAALFAVSMLTLNDSDLARQLDDFRASQRDAVLQMKLPPQN
jgi:5-(carboxyamino)imidazole ribonucleotide mutase